MKVICIRNLNILGYRMTTAGRVYEMHMNEDGEFCIIDDNGREFEPVIDGKYFEILR
ncbi:hypothetical protein [Paenibacillus cremeus]|uniref:hypothetical protein n=1 Tax=Paenibacillus cremeus TaxID=2163881 RepID=UPI0016440D43|nr:hypothetical protein [Paenibacillus cremeus]